MQRECSYSIKKDIKHFVNSFTNLKIALTCRFIASKMDEVQHSFTNLVQRSSRSAVLCGFVVIAAFSCVRGQEIVDRTVATVADGVRTELILYSDLVWQLALQPGVPLDKLKQDDLDRALAVVIDQRLFALEAERLPRPAPTSEEIDAAIREILIRFPSSAVFESRLRSVGFSSVKDEDFERLIARRVAIEKYVEFRFRSFVVVSADEENKYYRERYVPEFRQRNPGVVLPAFEARRKEIHDNIVEEKVATRIENFLDDAKRRVEIVILGEATPN